MRMTAFATLALFPAVAALGQTTKPSSPAPAAAQPPAYTPMRWNENYSYLKTAPDTDPFDAIKYIPIGNDGIYLSLGGQARIRYEYFDNENFGAVENDWGYALQRYLLHADLHLGKNIRVFGQAKTALVDDGRETPPTARPTDGDEIDLQQGFIDFKLPFEGKDSLTFRFGRQDLIYGAQRLISPLDWTNVRRTFDGGKVSLAMGDHTLDVFLVRPVIVENEHFNDGDGDQSFAGIYDTIALPKVLPGANTKLELYALGLWQRPNGVRTIDIDTYTLGTRFSTQPKPWDLDVELDYQFGDNADGDISAYSVAIEGGYTFDSGPLSPRVFLGFDYASGDDDATDSDKGTFNQLFPLGHAYFGYIDVIGRQNIIDIHPGVELMLLQNEKWAKKVSLRADYHVFWRAEEEDAMYAASGAVFRAAGGSDETFIGSEIDLLLNWQVDRHFAVYAGYSHFFAGDFIEDTGADDDIDFYYVAAAYTF